MSADLCEVCGGFTRGDMTLCAPCHEITRPKRYCQCRHEQGTHFPDSCVHSYWDALANRRVGCDCSGFKEAI